METEKYLGCTLKQRHSKAPFAFVIKNIMLASQKSILVYASYITKRK